MAEVEVDTETGEVDLLRLVCSYDVGKAINPMLVEGQIEGGAIMAQGQAMTEDWQRLLSFPGLAANIAARLFDSNYRRYSDY